MVLSALSTVGSTAVAAGAALAAGITTLAVDGTGVGPTLGPASITDLCRLATVPVFAWVAIRDVKTRRVSSTIWIPLASLAALLLAVDAWIAWNAGGLAWTDGFLLPAALSLGVVVPIAYGFWWLGGFGGADAKALLVIALLFPIAPTYAVGSRTFPLAGDAGVGAFALTILTNAVLVGVAIPVFLAIRNAAAGRIAPVMFVGWPVTWDAAVRTHGLLLQTPDGMTRSGLDLDALRMYLRWRGLTLTEVRADPGRYRDPATLPESPNPPTDGAITAGAILPDGGEVAGSTATEEGESAGSVPDERTPADDGRGADHGADTAVAGGAGASSDGGDAADGTGAAIEAKFDDPWGAEAFLTSIERPAYGTTPGMLRDGLDVLCAEERVWISPGTPFLVPVFVGLLLALGYGDLLVGLLF